eukprot:RCo023971
MARVAVRPSELQDVGVDVATIEDFTRDVLVSKAQEVEVELQREEDARLLRARAHLDAAEKELREARSQAQGGDISKLALSAKERRVSELRAQFGVLVSNVKAARTTRAEAAQRGGAVPTLGMRGALTTSVRRHAATPVVPSPRTTSAPPSPLSFASVPDPSVVTSPTSSSVAAFSPTTSSGGSSSSSSSGGGRS